MEAQRKEVHEAVKQRLLDQQTVIRSHLAANRTTMKALTRQQTVLKRELAVLGQLIRSLEPSKTEDACAKS